MAWHGYLLQFLSGALLANGVPHFVQGISGNPFPSPFAKPPGIGDSSPVVNVLWGLANLASGAILLRLFWPDATCTGWLVFFLGALVLSVLMATHFGKVRAGKR